MVAGGEGAVVSSNESQGSGLPGPVLAAVFLSSFCVLAFEVGLTRVFSVVLRYHFVFLVVSVAVCGLGLGGVIIHEVRWFRQPDKVLVRLSLLGMATGLLIPASLTLTLNYLLPAHPSAYVAVAAAMLLPFTAAGAFLSVAFHHYAGRGGRLYAADLVGAASAALVIIVLLNHVGAVDACFAVGLAACLAGLACALAVREARWIAAGVTASVAVVVLFTWNLHSEVVRIRPLQSGNLELTKPLFRELADPRSGSRLLDTYWNAFARTDVTQDVDPTIRFIYTDGEVPTHMIRFSGKLREVGGLQGFIGYVPFAFRTKGRVLCLGPGGGMDVLLALLAGFEQVEGVEINPSIPSIMEKHRSFNGGLYHLPGVHLSIGEGRSFVRGGGAKYDLLYMALTQTATSGNVGLALVESYVHTKEAFGDYYDHLTARGRLAFVCQEYYLLVRAFATNVALLQEKGLSRDEALRRLVVMALPEVIDRFGEPPTNPYRCLLMTTRTAVTPREADWLMEAARRRGVRPLYVPYRYEGTPFAEVPPGSDGVAKFVQRFRETDHVNVSPCTDDSPFFLDLTIGRPRGVRELYFLCVLALAFVVMATGLLSLRSRRDPDIRAPLVPFVFYFSCLGAGFMLIEVALAQKLILFLGYPTLSLSVILVSLLLGGGAGSYVSQRWPCYQLRKVAAKACLAVALAVLAYVFGLEPLLSTCLGLPVAARVAVTFALLLLLGFMMGMPFPSGLRLVCTARPEDVSWMWGVNGMMSVVGSVAAAMGAKGLGFSGVLMAGAVTYMLAAVAAVSLAGEEAR